MKIVSVIFLTLLTIGGIQSQVTYEQISDIIYNNCSVCHREGEIGPMSLTNYDEVKGWANMIQEVTSSKYMPPWKANPEYSRLMDETHLSESEISIIREWVETGLQRGDPQKEATFPDFTEGSTLGEPDLILTFAESYTHKGNNQDEYRWFVLPTGLTEDKIVKAVEFRPGNRKIVHHALIFEDNKGIARQQDALTPEYGYQGFGSFAGDESSNLELLTAKQFQGYAPGSISRFYPDGIGQTLSAGSDIAVQVHYAPWSKDESDLSSINIFFADETEDINRSMESHIMVPLPGVLLNGPFFMLPGQVKEFHGVWDVPNDISLVGISPHMHLLGKNWTVYLERPDGSTENLINIPDWDFNWQGSYYFPRYIVAPQGSKINALATYDNRVENPNNPNNPPQFVSWGEGTEDEMYYLPLLYTSYQAGDENIEFESISTSTRDIVTESTGKLRPITPNPVKDYMQVEYTLDKAMPISISIINQTGQEVRQIRQNIFKAKGDHLINIQTHTLSPGLYHVSLFGNGVLHTQSFVKPE